MLKPITFFLFLIHSFFAFAHSPQISTVALVQSKDSKWHLIVSCSLSAYEIELKNSRPNLILDSLKAVDFQRLFIDHLIEKIKITANDNHEGVLKNAKVILGHQTDINFEVEGMPEKLTALNVEQSGFETLRDHYCILKVITLAKESQNFILQKNNNYSITLDFKDNIFIEKPNQKNSSWKFIAGIALVLLVGVLILYFKK